MRKRRFRNSDVFSHWRDDKGLCRAVAVLLMGLLGQSKAWAVDFDEMTLEELLNVKIQGAAFEKQQLKSTPAAVTVVSAEDIRRSGARNLVDVLSLVPGISFATDTQGVIGIVIRGMWGHEGKVQLLFDGEEMNELSFDTNQFGNHFPVDFISRIEVIRGPGSAMHGGFAELGVINIISKNAAEMKGVEARARYGQTAGSFAERVVAVGAGKTAGDWKYTSYVVAGQGNQSSRLYTDQNGDSYSFAGNSRQDPLFVNLGATNEQWKFQFIYDRFSTTDRSAYGANAPSVMPADFTTLAFGASHDARISESFTLSPEVHFKQQSPWNVTSSDAKSVSQLYYDVTDQELTFKLVAHQQAGEKLSFHYGIEEAAIRSFDSVPGGSTGVLYPNGSQSISYYQNAAFVEAHLRSDIVDVTLGGRYQSQNAGGSAWGPRFAAIKEMGAFYLKGLYSWGFRPPGVENLRFNPSLTPETTKVLEVEAGYRLSSNWNATLNVFSNTLKNPIIYGYANGSQTYQNASQALTQGFEADSRWAGEGWMVDANYTYTHPKEIPQDYRASGLSSAMLGIANQKSTLTARTRIFDDMTSVSLSQIIYGARYGYDRDPSSSSGLSVRRFAPVYLTNVYLERSDVGIKGLSLGAGVFNLFDQDYRYLQPYDGGHPPIPAQVRDWVFQVGYRSEIL